MPTARPAGEPGRFHLLAGDPPLALALDGSRLYAIDRDLHDALMGGDATAAARLEAMIGSVPPGADDFHDVGAPTALSLNVAQACNLACGYCYADKGQFGGRARMMPREVALAAVDRLIDGADGRRVTLGFIGGEPFLNRALIHEAVEHAAARAARAGIAIGFSVTTNGSMLTAADHELIRRHSFAVTVSLDGGPSLHDRHRRHHDGAGSFAGIAEAMAPLLAAPGKAKIAARASVTRDDLRVRARLDGLTALGFREAGVSPVRTGPDPSLVFQAQDWQPFLREMIAAAEAEWRRVAAGGERRFSNLWSAVTQIHRGSARPLPCGSAVSYLSLGADGTYYSCHRTIDDRRFALGTTREGPDRAGRLDFIRSRHVDRQEPCASCWARYLCGGGCHAEVVSAGRMGCDYIRGWLEYCIRIYDRVLRRRPELLS
ncbi:MAG TPA: radical SAM protein [Stellaceae bacterium]|nr:radical SAM protein [Stellaceae bacterium]